MSFRETVNNLGKCCSGKVEMTLLTASCKSTEFVFSNDWRDSQLSLYAIRQGYTVALFIALFIVASQIRVDVVKGDSLTAAENSVEVSYLEAESWLLFLITCMTNQQMLCVDERLAL